MDTSIHIIPSSFGYRAHARDRVSPAHEVLHGIPNREPATRVRLSHSVITICLYDRLAQTVNSTTQIQSQEYQIQELFISIV